MHIAKQLAVFLDNRPGTLARLADALGEAKINIFAISTSDTVDHTVIRLVVSDYRKAMHLFEEHGTLVVSWPRLLINWPRLVLTLSIVTALLRRRQRWG